MRFLPRLRRTPEIEERQTTETLISLGDYWNMLQSFSFQGTNYTMPGSPQENITGAFSGVAQQAMKSDGVVFACMMVRQLLFSEARFKFRQIRNGRPGDLFGTAALAPLETPWPNGTTGDLLSRAIQDADLAGNAFFVRRPGGVRRLRPDWVKIVIGSMSDSDVGAWDVDADVLGYVYQPGGPGSGRDEEVYLASEVAHFAPIPDPEAQFRGMSWLTPIVREVMADKAATAHKLAYFENGATPNLVIKLDTPDVEQFKTYVELFKAGHEGAANAYKTIFLAQGADATVVGSDLKQLDFKQVQGAGETRIAAAAGVPPIIVGLSEGLEAATYSNYGQARRRFADGTMRPLWRSMAASLASIITVPQGSELWYDARDISFLQEDQKDAADIQAVQSQSIRSLVDAGFKPDSVVKAISSGDLNLLDHTDLYSVQLQPPGTVEPQPEPAPDNDDVPASNGKNSERIVRAMLAALPNPEA